MTPAGFVTLLPMAENERLKRQSLRYRVLFSSGGQSSPSATAVRIQRLLRHFMAATPADVAVGIKAAMSSTMWLENNSRRLPV
jgi:hypothetical protein